MTSFDLTRPDTWPVTLTIAEVAWIYHRAVGGIKKACQQRRFFPPPFQKHPYLWRRDDVRSHVERPGKPVSLRKVAG